MIEQYAALGVRTIHRPDNVVASAFQEIANANYRLALRLSHPPVPSAYRSFVDVRVAAGYDTAFGFLAKNNPEALDFMEDPVTAIQEEHDALIALCNKMGLSALETPAPTALVERGFSSAIAFPISVLAAHYL